MTQDIRRERPAVQAERSLPLEKSLIGWSLATGIVFLFILAVINHYVPATF